MKARGATKAAALLLASLWTVPLLVLAKDEPMFYPHKFDHPPRNLNYFDQSDIILFQDLETREVWRSPDGGETWKVVDGVDKGKAFALIMHEYDNKKAYIMTDTTHHYRTDDQGKTWKTFFTDSEFNIFRGDILQFHAGDPDRILFNGMDCHSIFCDEVTMYTLDGFSSDAKFLRGDTEGCWWAKGAPEFTSGNNDYDKQRIMCIVRDVFSPLKQDNRLLISDNYFSATSANGVIEEFEPPLDTNRPVQGIINVAAVKKYILVATTSLNTDEMALFVSDDTLKWHRAMFPQDHRIDQEAYTVLESTNYSIQIDVMTGRPSDPMGVMFTSNSNGTFFTRNIEHTNRNRMGHVDFEKITGIQGIFLVNQVQNAKEVENDRTTSKEIATFITHDDGRSFVEVHTDENGERINLHSVTQLDNVGRVFSSPAPGLVMANGNVGKFLDKYETSNLYISDDAGIHWVEGAKGPHKYEFGDQGSLLVAIQDSIKDTDVVGEIKYSLDHGQNWKTSALPDGLKIRPWVLTTTQDSTSLKFILHGEELLDGGASKFHVIAIDFDGLHERTCGDGDMEEWWARVDDDSRKPTCLMGHTQKFMRRKKDADCFMKQEFHLIEPTTTDCACTDADFECDYNFVLVDGKCVQKGPIDDPTGACLNAKPDKTFKGSNGYRLIPGNTCKRGDGPQKDAPVDVPCKDSHTPPPSQGSGEIDSSQQRFSGVYKAPLDGVEVHYLERGDTSQSADDTIIVRDNEKIMMTVNGGKEWTTPEALKQNFWMILPHLYFKDMVFFIKDDGKVVFTINRGASWDEFKAPNPPYKTGDSGAQRPPLSFHPDNKNWLIWIGEKKTDEGSYSEAMLSKDRGDNWSTLKRYVDHCEFTGATAFNQFSRDIDQIICKARAREIASNDNNPWQLVSGSANANFDEDAKVVQTDVMDFATMSEFLVVATRNETQEALTAWSSLDGKTWAEAKFPFNFKVPAYTLLDSKTHAVNLFVATSPSTKDGETPRHYGSIMKSNSNGTSYVTSVPDVNADKNFYVDFERMLSLEGVLLANTVINRDKTNEPKKLRSLISHNDGAEWAYLPPPTKYLDDKSTGCSGQGSEKCALHIHGYTERLDRSRTFSSAGAVGLMFAWGNVGEYLGSKADADTYMTTDAGISWKHVKKGRWRWQFGDQGSIIVLAPEDTKTNVISYTTNEGETFKDFKFAESEATIHDLTSQKSGASRKFIVWTVNGGETTATTLDFTGLASRPCEWNDKEQDSDYRIWTPKHPLLDDDCLFGHKTEYKRKKVDKECYNGYRIQHIYNVQNCTCSRRDYECDYNFEPAKGGDDHDLCVLVSGFQPPDHSLACKENPDQIEYYKPTGYRKIPLSTCVGGREFDKIGAAQECPGHSEEFAQRHGISGVGLFFAITLPFALAGAAGWWVYRNWSGKFGQIRLGDHGGVNGAAAPYGAGAFDSDSPFVRYPVLAISAAVAVAGAIPMVVAGLWRAGSAAVDRWRYGGGGGFSSLGGMNGGGLGGGGSRPFTTRDSFARGRGDYASVDDDEGELLGEDSDEEV